MEYAKSKSFILIVRKVMKLLHENHPDIGKVSLYTIKRFRKMDWHLNYKYAFNSKLKMLNQPCKEEWLRWFYAFKCILENDYKWIYIDEFIVSFGVTNLTVENLKVKRVFVQ